MASREREFLLGRRCRAALHGRDRRRCFRRSFDGLDLCVLCTCEFIIDAICASLEETIQERDSWSALENARATRRDIIATTTTTTTTTASRHRHHTGTRRKKNPRDAQVERETTMDYSPLTSQHPISSRKLSPIVKKVHETTKALRERRQKTYRDTSHLLRLLRGHNDAVRRRRRRLRGNSRRHHFVFFFFFF